MMKPSIRSCLGLLLGALFLFPTGCSSPDSHKPNVILLTLDTTRADRLGCYGRAGDVTPYLDSLAAGGVRFAEARCQVPITLPSHTSIFTGTYPETHGVHQHHDVFSQAGMSTLPEILHREGYSTASFLAAEVLNRRFGLADGFDHYGDDLGQLPNGAPGRARRAAAVTQEARQWFADRPEGPFFAWLHFFDPHLPYQPLEPFASRFPDDPYDAEVAYMDDRIGKLMAWLGERGDLENTIVAVIADHGESLGEHGIIGHTEYVYREVMWVPLLLNWPGRIEGGRTVPDLVRSVDLMPTLLDLLELDIPAEVEGSSLLPLMEGKPDQTARTSYFESRYLENLFGWAPLFGVETWPHKLIRAPRSELYHVVNDPGEQENLYAPGRQEARVLEDQLAAFVAEHKGRAAAGKAGSKVDERTRRALSSLGYVSGSQSSTPMNLTGEDPKDHIEMVRLYQQIQMGPQPQSTEKELEIARRVTELEPDHPQPWKLYGDYLLHFKRLDEAEAAYRRVTEISPEDPSPWVQLAAIANDRGDPKAFHTHMTQARQLDPDDIQALLAIGKQAFKEDQYRPAEEFLRKALEQEPDNLEGLTLLGAVLMEQGKYAEASQVLDRTFKLPPIDNRELGQRHYFMGRLLSKQAGKNEEATEHLDQAVKIAPNLPGPHYYLAVILAEQGNRSLAVNHAQRYLGMTPPGDPGRARMERIVAGG